MPGLNSFELRSFDEIEEACQKSESWQSELAQWFGGVRGLVDEYNSDPGTVDRYQQHMVSLFRRALSEINNKFDNQKDYFIRRMIILACAADPYVREAFSLPASFYRLGLTKAEIEAKASANQPIEIEGQQVDAAYINKRLSEADFKVRVVLGVVEKMIVKPKEQLDLQLIEALVTMPIININLVKLIGNPQYSPVGSAIMLGNLDLVDSIQQLSTGLFRATLGTVINYRLQNLNALNGDDLAGPNHMAIPLLEYAIKHRDSMTVDYINESIIKVLASDNSNPLEALRTKTGSYEKLDGMVRNAIETTPLIENLLAEYIREKVANEQGKRLRGG